MAVLMADRRRVYLGPQAQRPGSLRGQACCHRGSLPPAGILCGVS